jgi:hypothetical protein
VGQSSPQQLSLQQQEPVYSLSYVAGSSVGQTSPQPQQLSQRQQEPVYSLNCVTGSVGQSSPQQLSLQQQEPVYSLITPSCVAGSSAGQSKPQPQQLPQQQPQTVESYIQLLQQREEENRAEVERLTAEIRSLKLQLLQVAGKDIASTLMIC